MRRIFAIGETVYDIIFRGSEVLAAKAGGSMLNTAVSLGRLQLAVNMITEYGCDPPGDLIDEFLGKNGVDTAYSCRYRNGKTAIALAFLDNKNDARYSFYKMYPAKRLDIEMPEFNAGDIVLFGAFYSLLPEVRKQVVNLVRTARKAGALIIYDPNIRSPHKKEIAGLRKDVFENISLAHIVRGSDEDFITMFDISSGKEAMELVRKHGCNILLYTKSSKGVEVYLPSGMQQYPVPLVETVSTIGAGDSFNAGMICELSALAGLSPTSIENNIGKIVSTAVSFGSHVCTHYDNYISKEFARNWNTC
ncbi:MAG: PfkB family carbohydrate kinase [Bacteroidales bacterium]|nr:PfkB family carbohydrate kinase [Bacteroidales bacterium]